jgi:HEAT repeat protein
VGRGPRNRHGEDSVTSVLWKLKGGDRRSIGRSNEVVADVLDNPQLFKELFGGLKNGDPLVRMRAADALEKITAIRPEYLRPFKKQMVERVVRIEQQEVRWHVAQMLPRLKLDADEQARMVEILLTYLNDKSRIVKVSALAALAQFARQDARLRDSVAALLSEALEDGSPAVKARARMLLEDFPRP